MKVLNFLVNFFFKMTFINEKMPEMWDNFWQILKENIHFLAYFQEFT